MIAEPQTPSLPRRTLAGAGWIMAWRMAARLLGFVNTLVLDRVVVPSDFDSVALVLLQGQTGMASVEEIALPY